MADESDVVRAAQRMIENHGAHAAAKADQRAANLQGAGSDAAAELWRRIARAARQLLQAATAR
jgi:hypothetical protein